MSLHTQDFLAESEERYERALPREFDFYHLGQIRLQPKDPWSGLELPSALLKDSMAVAFKILADSPLWLVLLVRSDMNKSLYSEVGNIIACRLYAKLNERAPSGVPGGTMPVSPPQFPSVYWLRQQIQSQPRAVYRKYLHATAAGEMTLDLLIFPVEASEAPHGHA